MSNPSKARGTAYETAVVEYLKENGAPHVERRALAGTLDRGDITGLPGLVFELKNQKSMDLAGWVDEMLQETVNAVADHGFVVHKRRGQHVRRSYVTLQLDALCNLLRDAGYLAAPDPRPGSRSSATLGEVS